MKLIFRNNNVGPPLELHGSTFMNYMIYLFRIVVHGLTFRNYNAETIFSY